MLGHPIRSLACLTVLATGCSSTSTPPTTLQVDLSRYAGTWYQLAEPVPAGTWQDRGNDLFSDAEGVDGDAPCRDVEVTYTAVDERTVRLHNQCVPAGQLEPVSIDGTARSQTPSNTALRVRFDPLYLQPFAFDYWILDVDADYSVAVLGSPDPADGVSVLSRSPSLSDEDLGAALDRVRALGWDVDNRRPNPRLGP